MRLLATFGWAPLPLVPARTQLPSLLGKAALTRHLTCWNLDLELACLQNCEKEFLLIAVPME